MKNIEKDFLIMEYVQNERSMASIGRDLNVSAQTIQAYLNKYNIPIRTSINKKIDLVGRKFGKLTVIEQTRNTGRTATKWLCKCDCGKFVEVVSSSLRKGFTKSCRCDQIRKMWKGFKDISGVYWSRVTRGAKIRNLEFNISKEEAWDKFIEQNGKCKLSGINILLDPKLENVTASLDRIDSSKGYEIDNIQWVHKIVNIFRWKLSIPTFFYWVKLIYEHNHLETWTLDKSRTEAIPPKIQD